MEGIPFVKMVGCCEVDSCAALGEMNFILSIWEILGDRKEEFVWKMEYWHGCVGSKGRNQKHYIDGYPQSDVTIWRWMRNESSGGEKGSGL